MENAEKIIDDEFALSLLDNDSELFCVLLESFVNDTSFKSETLFAFVNDGRRGQAASYVHAVKGAARQLGAKRLASAGQALEDILRGKESCANGDFLCLCEKVKAEYEDAVLESKRLLKKYK